MKNTNACWSAKPAFARTVSAKARSKLITAPCMYGTTRSPTIAKVKRITGKTRSQWNGDRNSKPIRSAGFKGWRKFNGQAVHRG